MPQRLKQPVYAPAESLNGLFDTAGGKTLCVLLGPTGVGKTAASFALARRLGSPIISADSRQVFRELRIGSAAPSDEELRSVKHYFVGSRSVFEDYSAGQYEAEATALLESLFKTHDSLLLVGGSMMYIDAVCHGLDDVPTVDASVREHVQTVYEQQGLDALLDQLRTLDPVHYETVDRRNHRRVMRAVEVCLQTGRPYSELRTGQGRRRPFRTVRIGLDLPREQLYERINRRVDQMMDAGLLHEAAGLYPHRRLNSLNTVGYKELFNYFDGTWSLDYAVDQIRQDTRRYAKRQLTWFRSDASTLWFTPAALAAALQA